MPSNPTIYDVSRLSGVSTATVSRAFSNPEHVKEHTRRKVYEAAEALHYSPNAIARAMARQRTDKIAYLICKKDATVLDEFYAGICEGIMQSANHSEFQLLVSTAEDWLHNVSTAQAKQIEGVILGGDAKAELVSELQSRGVAVVLVNNRMSGFDLTCVVSDERGGVRQAVEHLIFRGHRHIAMIAGQFSPYISRERYTAFRDIMKEYGLPADDIRLCELNVESATQAAMALLQQEQRPTAVFATNDMIAAGTIKAARRLGLQIPEDLAVVGFDDSSICPMLEPELTSVHINCRRMGELCVEHLKALLDGKSDFPRVVTLPTELRIRRSV